MATVIALVTVGLAVLLNLVATVVLARSDFETPLQRLLQIVLIWAIPFIGSIMVIAVLKGSSFDRRGRSESGASGEALMPGSDVALGRDTTHHGSYGEHSGFDGHGGDAGHGGH